MEYISVKEAASRWGISASRIRILANEGRIPGAEYLGKSWLIPASATKPVELKADHSHTVRPKPDVFYFPLYHFRPDWSSVRVDQLTKEQQVLLQAETAVLECRFEEAYALLESIRHKAKDVYTEIGCLWNAGICSIGLNKPDVFSRVFLRLKAILSDDIPHRQDVAIILDFLKSYVDTIDTSAHNTHYHVDLHDECLPIMCAQQGYSLLVKEVEKPNSTDTTLLELCLRFLNTTSALVAIEMMHCYLLGIYFIRQDMPAAERHAKLAIEIAYESKYYFPLITYYEYFAPVITPILATYPKEFQDHCNKLMSQYERNLAGFITSTNKDSVLSKVDESDLPYIYGIMMGATNDVIADEIGVSEHTVSRKINHLCDKLGLNSKKDLREYLHNYL